MKLSKAYRWISLPLALLFMLTGAAVSSAAVWTPYEFTSPGHYEFRIQTFDYTWDDRMEVKSDYVSTLTVRPTGETSSHGERIFDVVTGDRRPMTESQLREKFSFGAFNFDDMFIFGDPFTSAIIMQALPDMDFEVGERMSILGMGRVSIVEEVTVAGRTGLVLRHEVGDAGNRQVSTEWTIDPSLPLPLVVRQYDNEGRLTLQTTLIQYEAR